MRVSKWAKLQYRSGPIQSSEIKIAVLKRNPAEAGFKESQRVLEIMHLGAQGMLAHQRAQIPLAGNEAHNRNGPLARAGFDQLHQFWSLPVDKGGISGARREPEDELVQKQNYAVVTESLSVAAHHSQAIQTYEAGGLASRRK